MNKVRLDKWLWSARFFKTRTLAKSAIESGKVQVDGRKSRPSKEIAVGMELKIRQGWDEKTVMVTALSDQRRGASEAATLYSETEQSQHQRQQRAEERRLMRESMVHPPQRPTKKQRRQIHSFKEKHL